MTNVLKVNGFDEIDDNEIRKISGGGLITLTILGCAVAIGALLYPIVKDAAYNKTISDHLDSKGK
jgi:hypothetical protein